LATDWFYHDEYLIQADIEHESRRIIERQKK